MPGVEILGEDAIAARVLGRGYVHFTLLFPFIRRAGNNPFYTARVPMQEQKTAPLFRLSAL